MLIWLELTHLTKFCSSDSFSHARLGDKTSNGSTTSYGSVLMSHTLIFFQNMSDGYVSRQRDI